MKQNGLKIPKNGTLKLTKNLHKTKSTMKISIIHASTAPHFRALKSYVQKT